jgi:short-subunit dehydrogenase
VTSFAEKYGPVAVVAGASEGLGAAFAEALAARGLHLVLLARRGALLAELASRISAKHGVTVKTIAADLGDGAFVEAVRGATAGLEVGLAVYNAAYSFTAPLLDRPLVDARRVVDVNVAGPLRLMHALVPAMRARGRGGVVLMASIAGFQGAPGLAAYAASKAFGIVLGESLWAELRPDGVDVITVCAGAIRTPNYGAASSQEAPGTLDAAVVAEQALDALGHGPVAVPGTVNKIALFLMRRVLTRAAAVGLMQRSTSKVLARGT